ncbi:hypothetical protein SAMN03159284_04095 [Mucilaginibacter sp. NFR10]|nr:hypothetical protein SAMN03159284_04095 [Mucilaginibacter sp. NFR10]
MLGCALYTTLSLASCAKSSGFYIDVKKDAIVSCNGESLNEMSLEDDSSSVTLRSSESVIYFNKKNLGLAAQMDFNGEVINDFDLKLKPKCAYKLRKHMGYDRGAFSATFKTDSLGNIIMTSNANCR